MKRYFHAQIRKHVGLSFLFLFCSGLALAQTGAISGTVTDASGAIVQGAQVSARNLATGETHATTTSGSGGYNLPDLPVGSYEVTIKKESFKSFRLPDIQLTVAQTFTANATLEPGAVTEEVQVQANQIQDVDLESAQLSNLVDQQQMVALPLITRDPYSLVLLSPGTSLTDSSNGGFSINGARDRNNNFLLDGVDNNDTSVPGIPDGVLAANPDSTEEFRVITDTFNAEFGRNTGGIIDVVTKSGTNTFHGEAHEFGRWNGFGGARDWFNPGTGPNAGPMDPYVRNQFGGSIGGPIIKNKTFFFFNDEMDRFRTTLTEQATVPTAAFKTGVFTYTAPDGTQIPIDLTQNGANNAYGLPLDPTMQKVFALYPNASSSSDGIEGNIFFPTTSATNSYNLTAKIDQHFTDRETLSLRYGYDHFTDPDPFHDDILPNLGGVAEHSIGEGLSAQLTSTLSNTLVNNFTFGWNHIYAAFFTNGLNALDSVSSPDLYGNGTDFSMEPFTSFGAIDLGDSDGQARKTGTISYSENLSWVHGNNTFKFGFDFRNVGENGYDDFFSRRSFNFEGVLEFDFDPGVVQGVPDSEETPALIDAATALYGVAIEDSQSQFFNKAGSRQPSDNRFFRQHEFDWYGQDTWKVAKNVTLNLGLRYQLNGVPYEQDGNFSNLLQDPGSFAAGQSVVFTTVGPGTGHSLYQPDYKDIEPRFGLAWDPWGDGKTSVRAGFGIFHDRTFGNAFGNARGDPPFESNYTNFPVGNISGTFGLFGLVPAQVPAQVASASIPDGSAVEDLVIFDTHFPNAASNNWNFDIQREVPGNNVVDVAYVGAMGVHVYGQRDGNPPLPGLVQQLVAYCDNPNNAFGCTSVGTQTTPATVSGTNLYLGATEFGDLPFNAVNNIAMLQPDYQINEFNSIYNGLQSKFTHRMSHGVQIQGAYTYSHAIDNSVDPLTPAVGAHTFPRNSLDLAESRGNSDNDTRHVGVINYIWNLPLGRGKGYINSGVGGKIFEGMQFSGITTIQSGHPFQVRGTEDTQRTGINAWASQIGDPFGPAPIPSCAPSPVLGYGYFSNQCAFQNPPWGQAGGTGRNEFYGPGFWNFDMAFSKTTKITERVGAELRFECYNLFNHPHFLNPGTDAAGVGNLIFNPLFGVVTGTASRPDGTTSARQMQVALRISF